MLLGLNDRMRLDEHRGQMVLCRYVPAHPVDRPDPGFLIGVLREVHFDTPERNRDNAHYFGFAPYVRIGGNAPVSRERELFPFRYENTSHTHNTHVIIEIRNGKGEVLYWKEKLEEYWKFPRTDETAIAVLGAFGILPSWKDKGAKTAAT